MKNRVTKVQYKKRINRTVILIFTRYCTYLLICCAIYSKVLWHGAKCTDKRLAPRNDLWSRDARPVGQNYDRVMCFYIFICKNCMHKNKIISNTMNL